MKQKKRLLLFYGYSKTGYTVIEVVIAIALFATLSIISIPVYGQWSKNAEFRASARTVLFALREARTRAIATNLEHRVEFESKNRRYRVTQGNRANNSNNWNTIVCEWVDLPQQVHMNANVEQIQLNTNGTANGGTIQIQDEKATTMYEVKIARTGRIRIPTIFDN